MTWSTQARMLPYWDSKTPKSPKRSYSTHGTMVAASPHAAAGVPAEWSTSGTTNGTPPEASLLDGQVGQP